LQLFMSIVHKGNTLNKLYIHPWDLYVQKIAFSLFRGLKRQSPTPMLNMTHPIQ
jgi:hypothetical protein